MEDDYMSDEFLKVAESIQNSGFKIFDIEGVTLGLTTSITGKRQLKVEKSRFENEEKFTKKLKRDEIETQRREEALNTPICETTKGFALLAKMGYKPGMSLGKKKDEEDLGSGIKVPLRVEVRAGRVGLGHGTDVLNKSRQRIKAEFDKMKGDADRHDEILEEFRMRKRNNTTCRQLFIDITNCRKACMDLDIRKGLTRPNEPWFWKSYPQDSSQQPSTSDSDELSWFYGNGEPASEDKRFEEMPQDELEESLLYIIEYLREEHFYCIWCGHVYDNEEHIQNDCPGPDKEQHE